MATSSDVERLERETAEARARLAGTLDRLTSPETAQAVKQELTDYAQGLKDEALGYVQRTKDSVLGTSRDKATGFADNLKQRALANPLGLALIGAGIGWHLYKKPPITTLLVGAGVAALMTSGGASPRIDRRAYRDPYDPAQPRGYVPGGVAGYGYPVDEEAPGSSMTDRASAMANDAAARTSELAHDLGTRARATVSGASEALGSVRSTVTDAAGTAMAAVGDAAETAQRRVSSATEAAKATVAEAAASVRTAVTDMTERTTSTITHTADQAMRRASGLARQAPTNPWLLGAVGLAFGTALAYSLRSSEAGERMAAETRRAGERSARGARTVRSGSSTAARRTARSAGEMASATGDRLSDVTARASETASGLASTAAETVSGVASGAGRILGAAGETVASSASGAYEAASSAASSAYRGAADLAASAGRRAPEAADRVQRQISELGERYPLLLGVVSLAIGAAVGGSLRVSESENRLMGPISDNLKQRARELANEQLGLAREAAGHFAGEFGTQLGGIGQQPDTSADFEEVIGGGKPDVATVRTDGGARPPTPSL